jgi:ABC-type antimicrobial peptide transport system permease subunit
VLSGVKSYRFFALFLGLILNIIILFIFFLSVLLIYSLLMVSVESRTFELGILRMVGMTRGRLVGLVVTQALFYSVPGIALGLPVAQGLAIAFTRFLSNIALVQLSGLLSPLSICLALLAGILVPLIAAVVPIRAALSKNVWDSVDTRRSKTKAVEYK